MSQQLRIGVDENGLGALLGPMIVTAVVARVDERGQRFLSRRLPSRLRQDLDDSKRLVAHNKIGLAEAWARALCHPADSPDQLFGSLSFEDQATLSAPCPKHASGQCWAPTRSGFVAEPEELTRVRSHVEYFRSRGVELVGAHCSVLCTKVLNGERRLGGNRFISDLHAMERLTLDVSKRMEQEVLAICGKVGGITDYSKFFGPLSGWLHAVLEVGRARSAYRFPGVGELHFVRDADAADPLVMLASLVGKYVRELLMGKISSFYEAESSEATPSGYHDPVTRSFIARTDALRRKRRIPRACFLRDGAADPTGTKR